MHIVKRACVPSASYTHTMYAERGAEYCLLEVTT